MKNYALLLLILTSLSFASHNPAYIIYNQKGKETKYLKMIKDLQSADLVFFGELHTDPISHWLQQEITKELYENKKENLVIGAEMFEADQQLILNEYLADNFSAKKFEEGTHLWSNYKTDYKPVVEFAKKNGLKYIATNIPRRYASIIYKKGFEGLKELSTEAKKLISPNLEKLYDKNVACYAEMMEMEGMSGHVSENFPKSQAAKDATMAHFILKNWEKGQLFIHFNGAYHSDNFEGIIWWINKLKPNLTIKTISVAYQKDIAKLEEENMGKASYIVAVPDNMTQTNRK
jgi:uncharacterized iron-regulated protein